MKNKILIIVGVVLAIFIALGVLKFINKPPKVSFTVGEYQIDIKAKEDKSYNYQDDEKFATLFVVENNNSKTKSTYRAIFHDIKERKDGVVYDVSNPSGSVIINGNTVYYWGLDKKEGNCDNCYGSVFAYYPLKGFNKSVPVEIIGIKEEDSNGAVAKHLPNVNEEILSSKELAKILDFKVSKK